MPRIHRCSTSPIYYVIEPSIFTAASAAVVTAATDDAIAMSAETATLCTVPHYRVIGELNTQ